MHACAECWVVAAGDLAGGRDGSAFSLAVTGGAGGYFWDPFETYGASRECHTPSVYTLPFNNGTVSTPSTVVFNNTQIGVSGFSTPLRATGTLTVTKANESLIKLQ